MIKEHEDILLSLIDMDQRGTLFGVFSDVPEQVYNHPNCPGVRAGQISGIVERSYSHWMHRARQAKGSKAFATGRALHAELLEGVDSRDEAIHRMVESVKKHPEASARLSGAQVEHTYFSPDPETGILKRCRVDALKNEILSDVKTCRDASEVAFARDCKRYLYRIPAAYYTQIVTEVKGTLHRRFDLIAVEKEEPHEVAVYTVDERSISQAEEEIRKALRIVQDVRQNGTKAWRGYPLEPKSIWI